MIRRYSSLSVLNLAALLGVLCVSTASAEIYQWVDENGNIQFGDKPHDPEAAKSAEKIEIIESYKPTQRTPEEQKAFAAEQEALKRRREIYDQEDLDARTQAATQAEEQQAQLCLELKNELDQMGQIEVSGGSRTLHFYTDENGKSLSSQQQREFLEQLRIRYEKECE